LLKKTKEDEPKTENKNDLEKLDHFLSARDYLGAISLIEVPFRAPFFAIKEPKELSMI
jgi:hypothetical protein